MFDPQKERSQMVRLQLARRDIKDQRVLDAMGTIPRHKFVPLEVETLAYTDGPLPIGEHQTISQPYIVALMTQLLELSGDEKVLEIGTGSGYQAAVLGKLARVVYSVEQYQNLAFNAAEVLKRLNYTNIHVVVGDGSLGWKDEAPYDAIIVTAAAPQVPNPLLEQLVDGGLLVVPVGDYRMQVLQKWTRVGEQFHKEEVIPVAFVPLRGDHGWSNKDWFR